MNKPIGSPPPPAPDIASDNLAGLSRSFLLFCCQMRASFLYKTMIAQLLLILMALGAGGVSGQGQTEHSQFLIVLDNSASMSRLSRNAFESISNLVSTGIQGQMRPGDPLVVWTFNQNVGTNFGRVIWDPALNLATANGVLKQLKPLRFDNKTRFAPLWAALKQAAPGVESLTVIIVTDGDDTISGTPFDKALNDVFLKYGRELRRLRKPFLITLQARAGQFLACNVCAAGVTIPFDELAEQIALAMPPAKVGESPPAIHETSPPPDIKPAIPETKVVSPAITKPAISITNSPGVYATSQPTNDMAAVKPEPAATIPSPAPETASLITNAITAPANITEPTPSSEIPRLTKPTNTVQTVASTNMADKPAAAALASLSPPQTNANRPDRTNSEYKKPVQAAFSPANTPKTNIASGFRPRPDAQPIPSVATTNKAKTTKPETAQTKVPAASKPSSTKLAAPTYDWVIRGIVIAIIGIVVIAVLLLRPKRAANQTSFISQGIERHLR